jgi:hypothetical protein
LNGYAQDKNRKKKSRSKPHRLARPACRRSYSRFFVFSAHWNKRISFVVFTLPRCKLHLDGQNQEDFVMKIWISCLAILLASTQICQAFPLVALVGDANHASLSSSGSSSGSSQSGKWGLGGGLLLEFPFAEYWTFELGGLDISRSLDQVGTLKYAQIPLQLRYWFGHHFVIGAGGYYAQGIGDTAAFSNAGYKTSDYGVLASIGVQKHIVPGFRVLLEGRYDYSLNSIAQSAHATGASHWSETQILFGFRIGQMP